MEKKTVSTAGIRARVFRLPVDHKNYKSLVNFNKLKVFIRFKQKNLVRSLKYFVNSTKRLNLPFLNNKYFL